MKYSLRPQYSLATLLIAVTGISIALAAYHHLNPNPPPVYPLPTCNRRAQYASYAFGHRYVTEITDLTFYSSPLWDRHQGNPPLSVNAAMVAADMVRLRLIAEKKLKGEEPADHGWWCLMSADLTAYNAREGKWFWVVRFEYLMSQNGPPNGLELLVLMDGTVLDPTITDAP